MIKVFVDGSAGTTGLRIRERLAERKDVEMIALPEEKRKDDTARKNAINSSDVTFLCLPDDAARAAVAMCDNPSTVIIDTSTAHRTLASFAYGFPELRTSLFDKIKSSKRIAVPGCHASGFIALTAPLIDAGIISPQLPLSCFSVTGYSGGGKKMIAQYEDADRPKSYASPRQYGLTQSHKHLKEMTVVSGTEIQPVFCPIVADFYSGMSVTVPLFASQINGSADTIRDLYKKLYTGPIVKFTDDGFEDGFAAADLMSGNDGMHISVDGNSERILLHATYDNLGKGASGAAVECFNIVTGSAITSGLIL